MDCRHAANILVGLKKKTLEPVIKYVSNTHPLKGLDILEHVPDSFLQFAAPHIEPNSIDETCIT